MRKGAFCKPEVSGPEELDLPGELQALDDMGLAAAAGTNPVAGIVIAFGVANVPVGVLIDAPAAGRAAVTLLQTTVGHIGHLIFVYNCNTIRAAWQEKNDLADEK